MQLKIKVAAWVVSGVGFIVADFERLGAAIQEKTSVPIALFFVVLMFTFLWLLQNPRWSDD